MKRSPEFVLDASALLALLKNEPGAAAIERLVSRGAGISSVNWAEVLSKISDEGLDPDEYAMQIRGGSTSLAILPFQEREAREAARVRSVTRAAGLSLGDRACLATARIHGAVAVTTDQVWAKFDFGIRVRLMRGK